jgi:hypothetical protein
VHVYLQIFSGLSSPWFPLAGAFTRIDLSGYSSNIEPHRSTACERHMIYSIIIAIIMENCGFLFGCFFDRLIFGNIPCRSYLVPEWISRTGNYVDLRWMLESSGSSIGAPSTLEFFSMYYMGLEDLRKNGCIAVIWQKGLSVPHNYSGWVWSISIDKPNIHNISTPA